MVIPKKVGMAISILFNMYFHFIVFSLHLLFLEPV